AEQSHRRAHQPAASGDRPRHRSPADSHRARLGLRAARRQLKSVRLDLFNTTAFRLSVGYTLLVTLAVGVTLGSAYLLTESLITDEIDLIIATELKTLEDQYARAGVPGVTDEINLKIDSCGRIGAVYTLAAALAGLWFSYKLARRVGEVTRTCQRILAGETGRRLPVAGVNDEFDTLAILVNRVLDRLEEQAGTLRATFDSAAHDLRAPLHRLRTRMDALLLQIGRASC